MNIKFNTSGQAFEDYGDEEVERILEEIIVKVKNGRTGGKILDVNGNSIGEWTLERETENKIDNDIKNLVHGLIGFLSSIVDNVDMDYEINDEGLTIEEGWKTFVNPLLEII